MSQLKKGALLSYLKIFLTNAIGLVLTPFIIKSLGDAEYGLYALIGSFVGYISVLDLGINNAVIRFIAKYRAENNRKGEENFLAITMMIYGIISLIIALLGLILYYNLDIIFSNSLTVQELDKAKIMFIILIFNLVIGLPGGTFNAVCTGYEHFVFPRSLNIIRYVVRSILVVGLLVLGGDAIGLVVLDTCMNILVIFINAWYVLKKLKVKFKLHEFHIPMVKEIFSYSIWVFLLALIYQFQWNGGQVIIGIKLDTVSVSIYAVGIMLGTYYGAFAAAINGLFLPRAMKMVVDNIGGNEVTNMTIKIGRVTLIVSILILSGFYHFGQEFIYLWLGESYEKSWLIALIIMFVSTNALVLSFADSTLRAKNLLKFKVLSYVFLMISGTFIGMFLINYFGILGMILGLCFGWMLSQFFLTYYFKIKLGFEIKNFYFSLLNKLILTFPIIVLFGYIINYINLLGWVGLFLKISLYVVAYSMILYFLGMNNYEKNLIRKFTEKK